MKRKWYCLGMLAIILAFGMMVVGCEEDEPELTKPATPTGLAKGTVSSNSAQLSWNSVSSATEYWVQYKEASKASWTLKEGITGASTTITGLYGATEYEFRVAAHNGYTSDYSSPITAMTLDHETAEVTIAVTTVKSSATLYEINVTLRLMNNAYWKDTKPTDAIAKEWVFISSGTPNFKSWTTFSLLQSINKSDLNFRWSSNSATDPSNLVVAINQAKLAEMLDYTNVTQSLNVGTPYSVTNNGWDIGQ